ncbi:MAG: AMP-binding protein [Candidatus Dormibacteria bacterium]
MEFRTARDFLLSRRADYHGAYRDFQWPRPETFNWALEWFDPIAAGNERPALWIVDDDDTETRLSFAELSARSSALAAWLRERGVRRGDHTLLMLGNRVALWECILALTKLGAVMIPSSTLLTPADIADRVERGSVAHVIVESALTGQFGQIAGAFTRIAVGEPVEGWLNYDDYMTAGDTFVAEGPTRANDPLFLYFTSGTTAQPKLVEHTHVTYPIGHLSTMYWLALQPGDVHLNISSPGWAKHAWSNVFAPWNAEATVLILNAARFSARRLLDTLTRCSVTSLCAPPTVWRMVIQEDLRAWQPPLREVLSAGEPLNPEVIEQVRRAWGLTIRDGYGQTETTAQIGNTSGEPVKPGSMGRPLPGYVIDLIDPATGAHGETGEICIDLSKRPVALMAGYRDDAAHTAEVMRDGFYHTGDVASRDSDGYITYVGRSDDVFKSSDYRISPFELESVLIEHAAVAEAAVVPSPDPVRLSVPKAFIAVGAGHVASADVARSIFEHSQAHLAGYKRIRRLEFAELPKTISGKIRRVDLRSKEADLRAEPSSARAENEYWEEDFPDLRPAPS